MTVRFAQNRLALAIVIMLLAGTVLGLSAHFAQIFLPNLHKDFTIFSLVVSSLTILVFLIIGPWSSPRVEAILLFIIGTLWLSMGAWSTDIMGSTQCDSLRGQREPTKSGDMSRQSYCYQMRVIQAFSWMNFAFFVIALFVLVSLVGQAQRFGRPFIWREPIRELGWFGEFPGYYNQSATMAYPAGYTSAYPAGAMVQPQMMMQPATQIAV